MTGSVEGMDESPLDIVAPTLHAIMMMCDAVQVSDGKLFILGGGLGAVGPRPQHIAIAVRIAIPWDQANVQHEWRVVLLDEDGQGVEINGNAVALNGNFEAGRPAGLAPGSELWVPLGINFGTLPLSGGRRYTWRLYLNGESAETWKASFAVRG